MNKNQKTILKSIIWIIVALICIYISYNENNLLPISIVLCTSLFLILISILLDFGYLNVLAGFNTMDENELKEYNTEKISSFLEKWYAISTIILFVIFTIILIKISEFWAMLSFAILFVISLVVSGIIVSTKNFKAKV